MANTPLLDLSTLEPERPKIRIDGTLYELAVPDDFGLKEQARLQQLGRRVNDLRRRKELSDDDVAELDKALREIVRMLVRGAPDEVLNRLRDHQRVQIMQVFMQAAGPAKAAAQKAARKNLTGAKSSRPSSDSTAAGRKTG